MNDSQLNSTCDILIYNGLAVTMDANMRQIDEAMIGIRNGEIAFVKAMDSAHALPPADQCIDAGGGLVMPGLINTHTHLPMSLFRGLADDMPLQRWLNEYIFPAEAAHINKDSVRLGALLSCAELMLGGVTTCCDGYFYEDQVAAAVVESGMRAVLGQGVVDFAAPGVPDPRRNVALASDFLAAWRNRSALVKPSIFCHSPYTCGPETLCKAKAAARQCGALFQIHVAETRGERQDFLKNQGCSPIAYLDRLGLLDADTLLAHAIWVDDDDIAVIARSKASVSVTTESEMKLASGIAPLPQFLAAGIPVGLGTDGSASNNDLDMWSEMDVTAKLHKVNTLDPTVADAPTMLKLATSQAARAIGWGRCIGSLEPGKAADIIVLDRHRPHLAPMYHPTSHLVYAARAADVRHVLIDGRVRVQDGRLIGLDLDWLCAQAQALADQIATVSLPHESGN